MKLEKSPILTVEEYLQIERTQNAKYEFHNGKIYALAGGTLNHGLICGNLYAGLRKQLDKKGSKCLPFNTDVKLHIAQKNSYVYPDSMVICGDITTAETDKNAVTNPVLIVEVLSKSTAEYDRGDKFHIYQKIPSFKEYVLIEQTRYIVDVYYKQENSDLWRITRYEGLDQIIPFTSLNISLSMEELYYRTTIARQE